MDTLSAYAMGMASRGNESKVFDWDEAAKMIRDSKCTDAAAGLDEDWGCTCGVIYRDGKPVKDDYTFLASTWATPAIMIDGCKTPCFKMAHDVLYWNAHTKWPPSALKILKEEKNEEKSEVRQQRYLRFRDPLR